MSEETPPVEEERTEKVIAKTVQELLRFGFLLQDTKPEVYQSARLHEEEIQSILEPLDLRIKVDEPRGLLVVNTYEESTDPTALDEAWTHPLVRRQRLTLEQSLLLALLRRQFLLHEEDKGIGTGEVRVLLEDIVNEMTTFLGDSGSDQNNDRRVTHLLSQLKDHGIVTSVNEHGEFTIRPTIVHLANPENLRALLEQFQALAANPS